MVWLGVRGAGRGLCFLTAGSRWPVGEATVAAFWAPECFSFTASPVRKLAPQAASQKLRFHLQSSLTQAASLPGVLRAAERQGFKNKMDC